MAKKPRLLTGKVAAITGAGRGIGRATAQAFVNRGIKVAIGDLDLELARRTARELGTPTIALGLDVTDHASMTRFIDDAEEQLGELDIFVNNAGIMTLGRLVDEDDASAARQVDINVNGVLYGMKDILPRFTQRGSGHLVNIASAAGKRGFPGGATYCGTKHFVVGVSEAARAELRGTGVEISCVMPGVVNTELASGLVESRAVRNVNPEDVAAAIVEALERPRFDVYVPKAFGVLVTAMGLLPRGAREAVGRAMKADKMLDSADPGARRAYELRAAMGGLTKREESLELASGSDGGVPKA